MRESEMLSKALAIASDAHAGQVDKSGQPYIAHPMRVALRAYQYGRVRAMIVGLLHDVVEDSEWSLDDLRAVGFDEGIVAAVDAITHRKGETRADYLARVTADRLATEVKVADVEDNSDPVRVAAIGDEATRARLTAKYEAALAVLLASRRDLRDAIVGRAASYGLLGGGPVG